jgi:tetratricopeptide (TPR) repeat protein
VRVERPLPHRPRRPVAANNQTLSLWLIFGAIAAAVVIWTGFQATLKQKATSAPVEGANQDLQKHVDELRATLERDTTNVDARVALADILYDTANWNDAMVQYRSVIRQDSSRATAIVDLGVCYYNLGYIDEAKRHFELGLKREPNHPIALFNLGIVAERQNDLEGALKYYHSAIRSNPPEQMMQPLAEAVGRVQQALGRPAPPLPGMPGQGMPGGMPGQGMPGGMPPQNGPPSGR